MEEENIVYLSGIKTYNEAQYAEKAIEASDKGENLYIKVFKDDEGKVVEVLEVAPYCYYICVQDNITNGEVNPNFDKDYKAYQKSLIDAKKMTPLDFLNKLKELGATDEQVEEFLNSNLSIKHQMLFCDRVFCGVVKSLCPIDIGDLHLTPSKIEKLFI